MYTGGRTGIARRFKLCRKTTDSKFEVDNLRIFSSFSMPKHRLLLSVSISLEIFVNTTKDGDPNF